MIYITAIKENTRESIKLRQELMKPDVDRIGSVQRKIEDIDG